MCSINEKIESDGNRKRSGRNLFIKGEKVINTRLRIILNNSEYIAYFIVVI